jgi:hypothetical protein
VEQSTVNRSKFTGSNLRGRVLHCDNVLLQDLTLCPASDPLSSIAVMLVRGKAGLAEFTDEAIRDEELLKVADKIRYELDPTIDYPRHLSGHVKIRLDDGTLLEENQPFPRGGYELPLPPEDIEEKFRANASLAIAKEKAEEIVSVMRKLETLPKIETLANLLAPRQGDSAAFNPAKFQSAAGCRRR